MWCFVWYFKLTEYTANKKIYLPANATFMDYYSFIAIDCIEGPRIKSQESRPGALTKFRLCVAVCKINCVNPWHCSVGYHWLLVLF